MLKEFAWKAFENTGDVNTYIFYKEMEERNKALIEDIAVQEEVAISNL